MLFTYAAAGQLSSLIEVPDHVIFRGAAVVYNLFKPTFDSFEACLSATFPAGVDFVRSTVKSLRFRLKMDLPLMDPVHVTCCIVVFASTFFVLHLYRRLYGRRRTNTYRRFFFLHHTVQFCISFYIILSIAAGGADRVVPDGVRAGNGGSSTRTLSVSDSSVSDWRMAKILWTLYFSKLVEAFGDTFLQVLMKHTLHPRESILHLYSCCFMDLYRRSAVFVMWWLVVLVAPGGDSNWVALVDSGIHVVIHGYYLGTALIEQKFHDRVELAVVLGQTTSLILNVCYAMIYLHSTERLLSSFLVYAHLLYMFTVLVPQVLGVFRFPTQVALEGPEPQPWWDWYLREVDNLVHPQ